MRLLIYIVLCSILILSSPVFAHEVLVIQSFKAGPFDDALRGFKSVCREDTKTVMVSDGEGIDIASKVRKEKPGIILAIGASALKEAIKIRNTPIVYLLVLNPEKIIGGRDNITGVHMIIPPGKYLDIMERLNLKGLKVGVIYDPANSDALIKIMRQAAAARGIELSTREVRRSKDVPETLIRMKGSFNLFWMIPDPTVVTPDTIEYLLLYTQQFGVPIVTFAGKYVDLGAMISLEVDSFDLGKQGGEIANRILGGAPAREIPITFPRKSVIRFNKKVAAKLGFNLNTAESGP